MSREKVCCVCKISKDIEFFNRNIRRLDGREYFCKACKSVSRRKYYEENKHAFKTLEARKKQKRNRVTSNKNVRMASIRKYRNSEKFKETLRNYQNNKYKNDLNFRLSLCLRSRINKAINSKSKNGSAVRDLGCTLAHLKNHLESKFTPGMSWDNWGNGKGKWNIDHIIPLCKFNLSDRQHLILAANYRNLQPLWFQDNLAKSGKY